MNVEEDKNWLLTISFNLDNNPIVSGRVYWDPGRDIYTYALTDVGTGEEVYNGSWLPIMEKFMEVIVKGEVIELAKEITGNNKGRGTGKSPKVEIRTSRVWEEVSRE